VRQLAAAFMPHLIGIVWINRAFKEGASKLAHSKGFASDKNYTTLCIPPPKRRSDCQQSGIRNLESIADLKAWAARNHLCYLCRIL
jgi:hypothetical protein